LASWIADIVSVIRLIRRKNEKVFKYLGFFLPLKIVRLARNAIAAKMGEK
jgi:hypothetical protein